MATPESTLKKIRLRNAKIIVAWARRGFTTKELAEKYKLTERRVQQIIYDNHDFVKVNREKERCKRINILNRLIEQKKEFTSEDITDLLEAQRKEIEGEAMGTTKETKVIIIRETNGGNKDQRGAVPGSVSVIRC
jgi:hypothetical protein